MNSVLTVKRKVSRASQVTRLWGLFLSVALVVVGATSALALPFNQDMAGGQNLQPGKIMRPKAPESVPLGSVRTYVRNADEAMKLQNPVPSSPFSIEKGKRLYEIHCKTCHGAYKESGPAADLVHENSPVYEFLKAGALVPPALHKSPGPDGYFFQMIHFGRQLPGESETIRMPAYGWKLSIKEHWDIINYLRNVQARMAPKGGDKN